jgi:hypothetical protein
VLFFFSLCLICQFYLVLEIVGLELPGQYIIDFSLFIVCFCSNTVFMLDALQLIMQFVRLVMYLKPKLFFSSSS